MRRRDSPHVAVENTIFLHNSPRRSLDISPVLKLHGARRTNELRNEAQTLLSVVLQALLPLQ